MFACPRLLEGNLLVLFVYIYIQLNLELENYVTRYWHEFRKGQSKTWQPVGVETDCWGFYFLGVPFQGLFVSSGMYGLSFF